MIMYLSGNFPQLSSPKKEKAFRDNLLAKGRPYHRLITIFYPQHCETVLNIVRFKRREKTAITDTQINTDNEQAVPVNTSNLENIEVEAQEEQTRKPAVRRVRQTTLF